MWTVVGITIRRFSLFGSAKLLADSEPSEPGPVSPLPALCFHLRNISCVTGRKRLLSSSRPLVLTHRLIMLKKVGLYSRTFRRYLIEDFDIAEWVAIAELQP